MSEQPKIIRKYLTDFYRWQNSSLIPSIFEMILEKRKNCKKDYERYNDKLNMKKQRMFTTIPDDKWEIGKLPKNVCLSDLKNDQKVAYSYMLPEETKTGEKLHQMYGYYNHKFFEEQNEFDKYNS